MKKFILPVITLLSGLGAGVIIDRHYHTCPGPAEPEVVTRIVRDTLRVRVPVPIATVCHDTVMIPMAEVRMDTAAVYLPRERLVYSDSSFRAVVSGVRPALDSLTLFPTTKIITRAPSRWSLSLTAGLAATPRGFSPGVTLGVSYRLFPL